MKFAEQTITSLIDEHFVLAKVLDHFGVNFYQYSEWRLVDLCREKGLDVQVVLQTMDNFNRSNKVEKQKLNAYPIDLVIEYLRHTHHLFIKQKLPYIARLIHQLEASPDINRQLVADLKFVFPLFLEDFIHHIYEEEDTLFAYALALHQVICHELPVSKVYFKMESYSIQEAALEHGQAEDEMLGFREITKNYQAGLGRDLRLKVIYEELKAFDKELRQHAAIEDEILFPKVLMLEKQVKEMMYRKTRWN